VNILAIHNYAEWAERSVELADRFTQVDARASDTHVQLQTISPTVVTIAREKT
jgi:hypothetical protein